MQVLRQYTEKFLHFFAITPELSIEERARRRLFTIFMLLLVTPMIIFGVHLTRRGLYKYGIMDVILAFVFLWFIFRLRKVKNARPMYRAVIIMLWMLLTYWVNTGAINGYASIWVLTAAPFSFYLMGKREGLFWTCIIASITAAQFLVPALSFTGFVYEKDYVSRHIFSLFIITLFTYNYEATRARFKNAMEDEQTKLKEHQAHLEEIVSEKTLHLKEKIEELEESEKRYRLFADNITDLIWSIDRELNFTYISPSVTRMYGYGVEEAMKLPHEKWNTPESYSRLMREVEEQNSMDGHGADPGRTVVLLLEHIKKDGTPFPVELKASFIRDSENRIIGYTGITRDISDRIRAEQEKEKIQEQLAQAQKMEAVGTLAGGLAHDFNNFLGGIMGSFELVMKNLEGLNIPNIETIKRYISIGFESSKKSADLIKQLLFLSRRHEITLTTVDIKNSIKHVCDLCVNSLPKTVEIECKPVDDPIYIMGEPAQIEQVLLNLCINASHAMTIMRGPDEKQGGRLVISADTVNPEAIPENPFSEYTAAGRLARIMIKDTGVGVEESSRKRIFEPFYSTKNRSEGTGLGLAISYNIIQKHGGFITVDSETGKGSCFTIYLPVHTDELITPRPDEESIIEHGTGTVLVIDDEIFILNIARGFLEHCGYDVITAEGAAEGIDAYRQNHDAVSAVLIDYSMPGRSGLEVFAELKKINSSVRALLSSGMLDNETIDAALGMGVIDTVGKPYTTVELSKKIRTAVSG